MSEGKKVIELTEEDLEKVNGGSVPGIKTESSDVVQSNWSEIDRTLIGYITGCPASKKACSTCKHIHEISYSQNTKYYCDLGKYPNKPAYI